MHTEENIAKTPTESWIYIVQAGDEGPVKIGWSSSPRKRFRTLQHACACPLRVRMLIPCKKEGEKLLHEASSKDRLEGEWFKPTAELLELAERMGAEWLTIQLKRSVEATAGGPDRLANRLALGPRD